AENLLRRTDDAIAIVAHGPQRTEVTFAELSRRVARCAAGLRALGIGTDDRVAVALPHTPDAIVAMLAGNAVGAICSLCDSELGLDAIVDRFGQIEPAVLVGRVPGLRERLPTVRHELGDVAAFGHDAEPAFVRRGFDDPAFILYTSGTTGLPKCIV